jgi:hypothetical protein
MTMLMGNLTTTLVLNRQTFFFLVNENGKSFALFRKNIMHLTRRVAHLLNTCEMAVRMGLGLNNSAERNNYMCLLSYQHMEF